MTEKLKDCKFKSFVLLKNTLLNSWEQLKFSADKTESIITLIIEHNQKNTECKLYINEVLAGTENSMEQVIESATNYLSKMCYVIKLKSAVKNTEIVVERNDLLNNSQPENLKTMIENNFKQFTLKNDNKGFRLLSKIGWDGGGLGAETSGITEPIKMEMNVNRRGFGAVALSSYFSYNQLFDYIIKYKKNPSSIKKTLVFWHEFSLKEKQTIVGCCKRLHLKFEYTNDRNCLKVWQKEENNNYFKDWNNIVVNDILNGTSKYLEYLDVIVPRK